VAKNNIYKILSITSLCFIIIGIILLRDSPLIHYQLSTYSGTPPIVWALLILSFGIACYVLIDSQEDNQTKGLGHWGNLALIIIILDSAVILLFPYIRAAWFMQSGDALSHVGYARGILETGHTYLIYPPIHIIAASLAMVTGISIFSVIGSLGPWFFLVGILAIYFLAKTVSKNRLMIAIAVPCAATFQVGYVTMAPSIISVALLPLVIGLYLVRGNNMGYRISSIICLCLYVFFHPLVALFLIAGIIAIELFKYIRNILIRSREGLRLLPSPGGLTYLALFSVAFLSWITYKYIMFVVYPLRRIIDSFAQNLEVAPTQLFLVNFPQLGITGYNFLILFLKLYGHNVIFLVLTVAALIVIFNRIRCRVAEGHEYDLFIVSGWLAVTGLAIVVALAKPEAQPWGIPGRYVGPLVVLTPVFAAYILANIYAYLKDRHFTKVAKSRSVKKLFSTVVTLLPICAAFTLMVFIIYSSPYIRLENQQVMRAEITGAKWVQEYTSPEIEVFDLGANCRLIDSISPLGTKVEVNTSRRFKTLPDHMGYAESNSLGAYFNEPKYVTLTRWRILRSIYLFAPMEWVTMEDLQKFYTDTSIDKIYDNYEYSGFVVSP